MSAATGRSRASSSGITPGRGADVAAAAESTAASTTTTGAASGSGTTGAEGAAGTPGDAASAVARSNESGGCAEGAVCGSGRVEGAAWTGHEPGCGAASRSCHFRMHADHGVGEAFTQRSALQRMDAGLQRLNGLALEVEGSRSSLDAAGTEGLRVLRAAIDGDQPWHPRIHRARERSTDGSATRAKRRDVSRRSIPDV